MRPTTPPPGSPVDRENAPPPKKGDALTDVALHLYGLGFNVIPVDREKKPIGSWSADKRLSWEELQRRLAKASGVAITGRYLEDKDYGAVVLDLDNVNEAFELLREVFGDEWPARLCGHEWTLCGLTGPRPKGKVKCECKAPGQDCECTNTETGERRKLSEMQRGMYVVVRVPRSCLPSGTIRSDAIEIMVSNYEVVYGRHPSGVFYEPVRYDKNSGKWVPVSYLDLGPGETVGCDEFKLLVTLISKIEQQQATANELQQPQPATITAAGFPEPTKELGEDKLRRLINLTWPVYQLDYGTHWHDNLLFGLACLMRRAGIKYEDARKVAETLINMWIQSKSTKLNEAELAEEMKKENKHIEETVDHVYKKVGYDSEKRCWGRKKFEEKLTSAVAKAIDEGLIVATSPKAWFKAIYRALGLSQAAPAGKGERPATGEQTPQEQQEEQQGSSLDDSFNELEKFLNCTDEDMIKEPLPPWVSKLEIREINECMRVPSCNKMVVSYTKPNCNYIVIAVRNPKIRRKRNGEVEVEYSYDRIARLPKYMGQVYDPYLDEWVYVAIYNGRIVAKADTFDELIEALRDVPDLKKVEIVGNEKLLDVVRSNLPRVTMIVGPGLTDNGFADPDGVLDTTDYGVEPLVTAYKWIKKYYPPPNDRLAWFTTIAALAKVITPMVRYHNRTFVDYVIYNYGPKGGEGKTSVAVYVAAPLLSITSDPINERYYVIILRSVDTAKQVRNLLSLNRMPLILDDQRKPALISNSDVILSAAVGMGIIGVHAARYGQGIGAKFKNLRGLIINTNVPFTSFLDIVQLEGSDYATIRRFLVLTWSDEAIDGDAIKHDLPKLKSALGFITRLWLKHKEEFIKTADLLELIEKMAMAIKAEYPNDATVAEIVNFTLDIVTELRETKERERRRVLRDEEILKNNARRIFGDKSNLELLLSILENPDRAHVRFVRPRKEDKLNEFTEMLRREIEKIKSMYSIVTELPPASSSDTDPDRIVSTASKEAAAVYSLLTHLMRNGEVEVFIEADVLAIKGDKRSSRTFLGAYYTNNNGIPGYYVPLAKLVRVFIGEGVDENGEDGEENEAETPENSNGGDHSH